MKVLNPLKQRLAIRREIDRLRDYLFELQEAGYATTDPEVLWVRAKISGLRHQLGRTFTMRTLARLLALAFIWSLFITPLYALPAAITPEIRRLDKQILLAKRAKNWPRARRLSALRREAVAEYYAPDPAPTLTPAPAAPVLWKYDSFPHIARLADSTLLAVWARKDSHAGSRSKIMYSTRAADLSAPAGPYELRVDMTGYGGAGALFVTSRGTIVMAYRRATPSGYKPRVMRSEDNGATWTFGPLPEPLDVGCLVDGEIAEQSGALYAAMYGRFAGDAKTSSYLIRSVDDGATWQPVGVIARGVNYNETSLMAGQDGALIALIRNEDAKCINMTRSYDGGATWSPLAVAAAGVKARPEVLRLASGVLVLASRTWTAKPIERPVLRYSRDDGRTWNKTNIFAVPPAGFNNYCALLEQPAGRVVILSANEPGNWGGPVSTLRLDAISESALLAIP